LRLDAIARTLRFPYDALDTVAVLRKAQGFRPRAAFNQSIYFPLVKTMPTPRRKLPCHAPSIWVGI
jgi:hypothetical protein